MLRVLGRTVDKSSEISNISFACIDFTSFITVSLQSARQYMPYHPPESRCLPVCCTPTEGVPVVVCAADCDCSVALVIYSLYGEFLIDFVVVAVVDIYESVDSRGLAIDFRYACRILVCQSVLFCLPFHRRCRCYWPSANRVCRSCWLYELRCATCPGVEISLS